MNYGVVDIAILSGVPIGQVFLLFCHEFGHALPVLLMGGRTHITIGSHDGRTVILGRLSITFGMNGLKSVFIYGRVQWSGVDSKSVRVAGILGGPLVTVSAVCAIGGILMTGVDGLLFWVLMNLLLIEVFRLYQTVVPKTYSRGLYEGAKSDGKRFLELLQS